MHLTIGPKIMLRNKSSTLQFVFLCLSKLLKSSNSVKIFSQSRNNTLITSLRILYLYLLTICNVYVNIKPSTGHNSHNLTSFSLSSVKRSEPLQGFSAFFLEVNNHTDRHIKELLNLTRELEFSKPKFKIWDRKMGRERKDK